MGPRIQGQKNRQQGHQQHLHQGIGGSPGNTQQLAAHRLKIVPTQAGADGLVEGFELGVIAQQAGQLVDQFGQITAELLNLGDQFRQQQLPDHKPRQQQRCQDHHQGLGASQAAAALELIDQNIQRHGHHHRAEEHQQHPAQLPDQQGQNDKTQGQQGRLCRHDRRLRAVHRSSTSAMSISRRST